MAITYDTFEDLWEHSEVLEGVHEVLGEVAEADGVPAISEAFLRGIDENRGHKHVVARNNDRVVGVLAIDPDRVIELAVAPDVRHSGVGVVRLTCGRTEIPPKPNALWSRWMPAEPVNY